MSSGWIYARRIFIRTLCALTLASSAGDRVHRPMNFAAHRAITVTAQPSRPAFHEISRP